MEELVSDRPWGTVWRVERNGETLSRKRCASIWRFEPRLTAALAARWPDRVAEVVESGDDWMLTRDAGTLIGAASPRWPEVARLVAELQQGEAVHAGEHVAAGVPDLRLATLPARFQDLVDYAPQAAGFEARFTELCAELAAFGVPETIQHDDLHHFNVYERDGRLRILDWGDSSVAHPWFSLVATLRHLEAGLHEPVIDASRAAYGAERDAVELGLRVGRIVHALKGIRQTRVLPGYDEDPDFARVLALAVAQTVE